MARVHISWHILLFLLVEVMALGRGRKCRHRAYSNFAFITSVLHLPEFVLGACYSCGSHLERAHLSGDQALSQRQGCRMEMHKFLALLWFHLMGGVGVCWAWRQAKCFWQINWKSTTSSTTDEGFWHSPYSVTVSCLKISAVPQWEMPFAFWITPPWWGAGALAGFGNCRIAFRREVTTHTRECDTSAVSAEEPWPCLRLFSLLLPCFPSFSSLLSISFLSPLFCLCVTHGNALTQLSTPLQTNHSVPLSLRCGSFPISFALLVSLHMY